MGGHSLLKMTDTISQDVFDQSVFRFLYDVTSDQIIFMFDLILLC